GDGADDLQVGLCLEQRPEPVAHQAIVVDDQYSNPLRQESLRVSRAYPEGREGQRGERRDGSAYRIERSASSQSRKPSRFRDPDARIGVVEGKKKPNAATQREASSSPRRDAGVA